ncbi:type II toxin-antitoxin system death-on-curing family toxin [Nocardia beijingensis]|uniref:type II toxin-antitoxin system death-on-curing family toxin n=1 Tax=Nocardia beijingensis TaxID=95162 RepID=UPI000A041673|nr:Fic family protein [Nocardia beijingensis]
MTPFALPVDGVIATNRRLTGTSYNVIDRGKLESALARPLATGFGQPLYPTALQRGAALLGGLAAAHAFIDANKRTAWLSCNIYLNAFNSRLQEIPENEAADFVEALVVCHFGVDDIAAWLAVHLA